MRAIGFCHLLLQSRALVSRSFSTRSLPRARGLFRFPRSPPVPFFRRSERSSTQRFHAARVTVVDQRFRKPLVEPLSCLSRLFDVPARGSLLGGPHTEVAPRALRDAIREDLAVLRSGTTSIERYISAASVLRRLPRATGSGPDVASLSGFRWFCRQRAVHCAVSPMRYRVAFANAVASARPPCTPACLIDAGASLGQSQPFDFCNEFSKYDTRARVSRALSSPEAGVGPAFVATHDALLTLLGSSSFECKEDSSSVRRSELRVIPRRSASRAEPQKPESFCPHERHRSSGPAGHGKRAGRKSRAKVNAMDLAIASRPVGAYAPRSLL